MAAALAAKAMNFHAGEETWALKQLATVSPAKVNSTFIKKLEAANFTFLLTIASRNITQGGKTNAGEWIDIIRFRDWQQYDMQVRVVNLLVVNPKVPVHRRRHRFRGEPDEGIPAGRAEVRRHLSHEFDADGNSNPGFVTSVPLAADISSTKKASRVLSDCKWSARLAGAIHMVEIGGRLTYENLT